MYYDGANMNAIMGTVTSGVISGFDVIHINVHKNLSQRHTVVEVLVQVLLG